MSNALTTFTFTPANAAIRVVEINGEPWFVAADVCRALGMNMASGTYRWLVGVPTEERRMATHKEHPQIFCGGSFTTSAVLVSEAGLYRVVLRSTKPEARAFQDWVTRDVLPAIRKEGVYVMGEEKLKSPDLTLSDLDAINDQVQALLQRKAELMEARALAAEAKLAEQAPKVAVVESHFATTQEVPLNRFARSLDGVNSNAVKRDLMRHGYLYRLGSGYRVRSEFRGKLFVEKRHPVYLTMDVFLTALGQQELTKLHATGGLTLRKS